MTTETTRPRSTVKDSIGLPFTTFRAADAIDYARADVMTVEPDTSPDTSDVTRNGMATLMQSGLMDGSQVSLLFSRPGLSLTYVWFKSGYALPRHSHNADCAYFIIAGSLRMGDEHFGPGDGFFIGTDVPYAYTPGPQGVEVLEIRTSNQFDFKALVGSATWYENAAARMREANKNWGDEAAPPSGMVVGRK